LRTLMRSRGDEPEQERRALYFTRLHRYWGVIASDGLWKQPIAITEGLTLARLMRVVVYALDGLQKLALNRRRRP
jgi:hypothetical protein